MWTRRCPRASSRRADPGQLTEPEHREWRRSQAFGFLANGQPHRRSLCSISCCARTAAICCRGAAAGALSCGSPSPTERVNDHRSERPRAVGRAQGRSVAVETRCSRSGTSASASSMRASARRPSARDKFHRDIERNPRTTKASASALTADQCARPIHHQRDQGRPSHVLPRPWRSTSPGRPRRRDHDSPRSPIGGAPTSASRHVTAKRLGWDVYGSGGSVTVNEESFSSEEMWGLTAASRAVSSSSATRGSPATSAWR